MSKRTVLLLFFLTARAVAQDQAKTPVQESKPHPYLVHAELPLYPAIALFAHASGTVEIEATVENGSVVNTLVKSDSNGLLSQASVKNLRTWQFESGPSMTFRVKYIYVIEGAETALPENPKVELDLPWIVKLTAKPVKPPCEDCRHVVDPSPNAQ
jgi:hypothetical protein